MKKLFGGALIAIPFIAVLCILSSSYGWWLPLSVFVAGGGTIALISWGCYILNQDDK